MSSVRAVAIRGAFAVVLVAVLTPCLVAPVAAEDGTLGFPPTVDLTDPGLLKGQTHKTKLHYQVLYEEPVQATFDVVPRAPQAGDGWQDASAWVRLGESGPITIAPTEDHPLEVTITVPATAANGEYRAGVRIRVATGEGPQGSGAGVEQAGTTILLLRVTGQEVKRIASEGTPVVRDVEVDGPWSLSVPLTNDGNVRANPHVRVEVWDQMRTRVVKTVWSNGTFLEPGESSSYTLQFASLGLPLGQYWAAVEVFLDGVSVAAHSPVTFDVVEQGSLKRLLELRTIRVAGGAAWAEAGDLVAVAAVVRNAGDLPVEGMFRLKVERDGKLLDVLDSDPLEIPVGEERPIEVHYRVDAAGVYAFIGHVRYGTKVTDERTTLLNVQENGGSAVWAWLGGGLLVAVLGALAVVSMQRRRGAPGRPVRVRKRPAPERRRTGAAPMRRRGSVPPKRPER